VRRENLCGSRCAAGRWLRAVGHPFGFGTGAPSVGWPFPDARLSIQRTNRTARKLASSARYVYAVRRVRGRARRVGCTAHAGLPASTVHSVLACSLPGHGGSPFTVLRRGRKIMYCMRLLTSDLNMSASYGSTTLSLIFLV
jgi:hypothetical protein